MHWGTPALRSSQGRQRNPSSLWMKTGLLSTIAVIAQLLMPLCGWFLPFVTAYRTALFSFHMNIFTLDNYMECFPRIPSPPPMLEGGHRGETPADNLDIAQASFELPWQIQVKSHPHSRPIFDAISICSSWENNMKCCAAISLIFWRSCLSWSSCSAHPTTLSTTYWSDGAHSSFLMN